MEGKETNKVEILEAENAKLRKLLAATFLEYKKQNIRLAGVDGLVRQLHLKKQETEFLKAKGERLEETLTRAEHKIAQLSHCSTRDRGSIALPGVSKRVLLGLARDNARLKQTLQRLTNGDFREVEFALENRCLHEVIMNLRDERYMERQRVDELKQLLAAIKEESIETLKQQSIRLTEVVARQRLELNAKQAFCEKLVAEHEVLKEQICGVVATKAALCSSPTEQSGDRNGDGVDDGDEDDDIIAKRLENQTVDKLMTEIEYGLEELAVPRKAALERSTIVEKIRGNIGALHEFIREQRRSYEGVTENLKAEFEEARREIDRVRKKLEDSAEAAENDGGDENKEATARNTAKEEDESKTKVMEHALEKLDKSERDAVFAKADDLRDKCGVLQERMRQQRRSHEEEVEKLKAELEEARREIVFTREKLEVSVETNKQLERKFEGIQQDDACRAESWKSTQEEMTRWMTTAQERGTRIEELLEQLAFSQNQNHELAQEIENLRASVVEMDGERQLMQTTLKDYEKDFKKEREEKLKAERERRELQGKYQDVRGRYRHFMSRFNPEYMNEAQREERCHSVVDHLEAKNSSPSSNELQCPTCKRMIPHQYMEDHIKDCTE